jgi:pSer/pThr/pTyr-binding forkhead associated (FHA) protein
METTALTLALIERLDDHGQVLQLHRVHHWPQKIGRAVDNDLLIDDPHVAAHHAVLAPRRQMDGTTAPVDATLPSKPVRSLNEEQALELAVGDTLNGVSLLPQKRRQKALHARSGQTLALKSGSEFQVGGVTLRLRLPSELLAPEQPLQATRTPAAWQVPALAAVGVAGLAVDQWTQSNPGTPWLEILSPVLAGPFALLLWCATWALFSKLFRGQFALGTHLRIALPWVVGLMVLVPLLHQASFSLSWPSLSRIVPLLEAAGGCALVWQHLSAIVPKRRWHLAATTALGFVTAATYIGYNHQKSENRWFEQLYATTLSLPALRVAPSVSVESFMGGLRSLEGELERVVSDVNQKPGEEGE